MVVVVLVGDEYYGNLVPALVVSIVGIVVVVVVVVCGQDDLLKVY